MRSEKLLDGFQEEWLQCRRTDQERSIRDDKKKVEQAKKRLADLDVIISRLYEDHVLGELSKDRYQKMSAGYEEEQERLKFEIEVIEEWVEQREEVNDGLDAFIALTQKYVDVQDLTQTIVNEYFLNIFLSVILQRESTVQIRKYTKKSRRLQKVRTSITPADTPARLQSIHIFTRRSCP